MAGEMNAPWWQSLGYDSYDAWALDNGAQTSTGQVDPLMAATGSIAGEAGGYTDQAQQTQNTGGGTVTTPKLVVFKGIQYDLNNTSDRNAFIQVQSGEVDKKLNDALKSGQLGYAAKLLDYKHQWEAQGQTLQEGYNQGTMARQQAYQGLGTRAYQSSMGTSGQYALNKLGEAQNERNYQKNQYNTNLENAYNDWINGAQQNAQSQKDTLATNVANIGGFDAGSVPNSQVDLSSFTPFTNFQSFQNSTPQLAATKSISNAPTQTQTLSQYLQQNDTAKQDPNYLTKFLAGQA